MRSPGVSIAPVAAVVLATGMAAWSRAIPLAERRTVMVDDRAKVTLEELGKHRVIFALYVLRADFGAGTTLSKRYLVQP